MGFPGDPGRDGSRGLPGKPAEKGTILPCLMNIKFNHKNYLL